MNITTNQLRIQPGRIISQVNGGQEITVTFRGKACAKIVPIANQYNTTSEEIDSELFGIWKDRDDLLDVEQYVRNIRKRRKSC
ncbi:hypothetical protein AGMMS50229_00360 [Campylobacterota bacterium]|nr:hypothetical protein AGMMS50229_00360 [Campylobacterota bacterium]